MKLDKQFLEGFDFAFQVVYEIGAKNWTYNDYIKALQRIVILDKGGKKEIAVQLLKDAKEEIPSVEDLI